VARPAHGRPCISFVDPWKPSRQARGVVTYAENQLSWANQVVRAANFAERNGQPSNRPPLDLVPFALFGLHNTWARNAPADRRIVRLSDGNVRLNYAWVERPPTPMKSAVPLP
jgi:ATP-dependent RNA helicase HelY